MRFWLAAAVAGLVLAGATPALAEPSPRALDLARRYARAINFEAQMAAIMDNMVPAMVEQKLREKGETLPTEMKAAIGKVGASTAREISPRMLDAMIPVIAEVFTEAEMQAAIEYYESPLGRSLLAKTPTFTARLAPTLTALTPEIEKAFETNFCREIGGCEE